MRNTILNVVMSNFYFIIIIEVEIIKSHLVIKKQNIFLSIVEQILLLVVSCNKWHVMEVTKPQVWEKHCWDKPA